jgi:hyperosmotically inducible periplasmic protein
MPASALPPNRLALSVRFSGELQNPPRWSNPQLIPVPDAPWSRLGGQLFIHELAVREGDRTAGRATDDAAIAAKVKGELAADSGLGTATNVNVEVRSGVVQLSGFVASVEQKQEAEQIARQVAGVTDVRNSIAVQAPR